MPLPLFLLLVATPLERPPSLMAAIRGYDAAQGHGDRPALERWLADDDGLINSSGARESKAP